MNTTTIPTLPPLRGWISTYHVKQGAHKFGPYHVRVWKEKGKTYKQYIKPNELEQVRAACQANRELRKEGTRIRQEFATQSGNLKWLYRMNKRLETGPIRDEDWAFMHVMKRNGFNISGRPKLRRGMGLQAPGLRVPNDRRSTMKDQRIMVPSPTKRFMNPFEKIVARIVDERNHNEPVGNKWQRWRIEKNSRPPAPKPDIELPEWISEEEITNAIKRLEGTQAD